MSLASVFNHVQVAADELHDLLKEEARREEDKPTSFIFLYDQTNLEENPGEWWPNYQLVEAYDVEEAFRGFGHVITVYGLVVKNISYGPEKEMMWAMNLVSDYWEAERALKQRREKDRRP